MAIDANVSPERLIYGHIFNISPEILLHSGGHAVRVRGRAADVVDDDVRPATDDLPVGDNSSAERRRSVPRDGHAAALRRRRTTVAAASRRVRVHELRTHATATPADELSHTQSQSVRSRPFSSRPLLNGHFD